MLKLFILLITFILGLTNLFAGPSQLPLVTLDDFDYQGAFRLKAGTFGDSATGFSGMKIAYNDDNRSLFVQSKISDVAIGEYELVDFTKGDNISNLLITNPPIQNFSSLFSRTVTGNTQGLNAITGMHYLNGEIYLNAVDWYDAPADNTHTTLVIKDASDLKKSRINGFYELDGKARGAGWITKIPLEWQSILGGDYISGYSSADSIVSRSSVGPSAFVININDFNKKDSGKINATPILDYKFPNIMFNPQEFINYPNPTYDEIYFNYKGGRIPCTGSGNQKICIPENSNILNNSLWTTTSKALFGFIIPGTRTYATFGSSSGHESGLGYKIVQNNGNLCGGPCPYDADDSYNYYWLFDLNDLIKVKNGEIETWDVIPYEYGEFKTPFDFVDGKFKWDEYRSSQGRIRGGAYNYEEGILYLSVPGVDWEQSIYEPGHLVLSYKINLSKPKEK